MSPCHAEAALQQHLAGQVGAQAHSAVRWALSVQSGSSPASLMNHRVGAHAVRVAIVDVKLTSWPLGSRHSTVSGTVPCTSPSTAARAAAAEHAPVVKPVRVRA